MLSQLLNSNTIGNYTPAVENTSLLPINFMDFCYLALTSSIENRG